MIGIHLNLQIDTFFVLEFVQPDHSPKEPPQVDGQEKYDTKVTTNYGSSSDRNTIDESSPILLASIIIAVLVFIIIGLIIAFGLLWYNKERKLKVLQGQVDGHRQNQELQYQGAYHTGRNHGNERLKETGFDFDGKFDDGTDKDSSAKTSAVSYQIEQHVPRSQTSPSQNGITCPKHRNRSDNEEAEVLESQPLMTTAIVEINEDKTRDSKGTNQIQSSVEYADDKDHENRSFHGMDNTSHITDISITNSPMQEVGKPLTQPASSGLQPQGKMQILRYLDIEIL